MVCLLSAVNGSTVFASSSPCGGLWGRRRRRVRLQRRRLTGRLPRGACGRTLNAEGEGRNRRVSRAGRIPGKVLRGQPRQLP